MKQVQLVHGRQNLEPVTRFLGDSRAPTSSELEKSDTNISAFASFGWSPASID